MYNVSYFTSNKQKILNNILPFTQENVNFYTSILQLAHFWNYMYM